jgi:hydrogenase expression/formation protein HypD
VTGFEPVDLLQGILACVQQLEAKTAQLTNCYRRAVSRAGNAAAAKLIEEVYEVVDQEWRGLGIIPNGGFRLRAELEQFDAARRFADVVQQTSSGSAAATDSRCRAGDVLSGRMQPPACEEFGRGCTPDAPLGAPMVSSEGACSAWFRYVRRTGLPQHQAGIERST